jgi:hypothetical protein
MTMFRRLIAGMGMVAGVTAGLRLLSRRRTRKHPFGLPEAQLSDEEREQALRVSKALEENTTEAPLTG